MTKKTDIRLAITSANSMMNVEPYYTVKIDGQGFPYIIWNNEKIIISRTDFPFETSLIYGLWPVSIDIITGLDALKAILENPALTVDKLTVQQLSKIT